MSINKLKKSIIISIICIVLISIPSYSKASFSHVKNILNNVRTKVTNVFGQNTLNATEDEYAWTDNVLFLGDSITAGLESNFGLKWGRGTACDSPYDCYSRIDVNKRVYVGTTTKFKGTGTTKNYELPLESEIEGIAIMIGTNGAYTSNVKHVKNTVIDKLRVLYPNTTIYIEGIPPFTTNSQSGYSSPADFLRLSIAYNNELKDMCSTLENVVYVEVATELKDSNGYLKNEYANSDGVHPNKSGGQVILNNLKSYMKKTVDMSNIKFEDKTVTYNGKAQFLEIYGKLPEGVTVTYEGNGQINVGEYEVIAKFTVDTTKYKEIPNMTAKLIIEKAEPIVNPVYNKNVELYEGDPLPEISLSSGDTKGTINWDKNILLEAGTQEHAWTFIPTDETNYNKKTGKVTFSVLEKLNVEINEYDENGLYITKIKNGETINEIRKNIETNGTIAIYKGERQIEENEKIGTGMIMRITLGKQQMEYIMVVKGDTNGDGEVNITDILQINKHRLNKVSLLEEYAQAGDVTEDGKVDVSDILKINKLRLGKIDSL